MNANFHNMASGKIMSTQLSMDSDPLPPQSMAISFRNEDGVSVDAMAGPRETSRRSTQELKQEAKQSKLQHADYDIEKLPPKSPSSSENELLADEIGSEIRRRVGDMSINKGQDSSYGSMSPTYSISCSSMPSANWEDELKRYEEYMPPHIRVDYIDVLILYCEDDREEAQKFQTHLREEITVPNGPIKTLLYDDAEMQAICGSKIGHLERVVQRSTYVFIFMTKNFIEDKWCEFSSESCLMEAITNPLKQWCVVPVYTEKRNTSFRVPMGLNTLKGINYYNNDRFYKNGVSRLIGDKIHVRIKANQEHKIKQKEWLENYKRDQAVLKEKQRRTEEVEKAKTRQLLDWLDMETRRLIHAGALPNYLQHSNSESDISNHASSLPHSASSSSLKPIYAQNPAVTSYFQTLLNQQKIYHQNSGNYSPEQMKIIEQVHGGPQTPIYSPPVMNSFHIQGQYGQGQGYFRSASYHQTNHQQVNRSNSQASTDMVPSAEFILHTETGDVSVSVPSILIERIKDEPQDKQQEYVKKYLHETQQQKLLQNQAYQSVPSQPVSNAALSMTPPTESNPALGIPNFDILSMNSARNSQQMNSYSDQSGALQSNMSTVSSQNRNTGQLGNYMDGSRSYLQEGGNMPNASLLEQDAGSSLESRNSQSISTRKEQVYQAEKTKVKESQSDSESDDESPKSRKKSKAKGKQVVHIHKTYIYQPGTVQIGDHNVVQENNTENDQSEGEGEERGSVSKDSELPFTDSKTMQSEKHSIRSEEKQKMKKVEIETGSETHGEMQDQPGSSGGSSSCNVDAAPSTVNKLPSSVLQYETKKKQIDRGLKIKEEIEEAQEVIPDEKNNDREYTSGRTFENSSKFDENCENVRNEKNSQFEGSVNFNSSSSEKSSSLKRKEIPTGESPPKQVGVARPVAAVSPFTPKDDSDDNCDNTDPKTVVNSQLSNSDVRMSQRGSTDQTFVKVVCSELNNTPQTCKQDTEQLQRNLPAQVLTKCQDLDNTSNGTFSRARMTNPSNLFFRHNTRTASNEECSRGSQEVALGNDPLSRETAEDPRTEGFNVQSSAYKPLEDDNDELEFDMLHLSDNHETANYPNQASFEGSGFEESGTKSEKTWKRKGDPTNNSKKECVIS